MSHFDLSDKQGNNYRLSLGTRIPLNDNIAGHPAQADALLYQVDVQQLLRARQHFYGTGQFPILGAWQQERLGNGDAPLCPFETLVDALCHHELTLIKVSTGEQEGGEDRRGILRVKIRQALAEIVAQEKIEAAGHARRLAQEGKFGQAMIYTGAFFSGLWDAGADLVKWASDINDVFSPSQRLLRPLRAAARARKRVEESGEDFSAAMADEYLKGEKRELVELIGFDPTAITSQQVDLAIEITELIWDDAALRQDITRFALDYANAQHDIEIMNLAGGVAFEVLFTIVLTAVTMGAGLSVGAASQVRHLRKFRKVGKLFMEFAEVAKKIARKARKKAARKSKGNAKDFKNLPFEEVDVKSDTKIKDSKGKGKNKSENDVIELEPGEKGSWNKKLNGKLEPNSKYKVGNYLYETDAQGRVSKVSGKLDLSNRDRNGYQQGKAGKTNGIKDGLDQDEGGHLIASIFDGPGEQINYAAMDGNLNKGAWKRMENKWASALKSTPPKNVEVNINAVYKEASKRPDKFVVEYIIDGEPKVVVFKNAPGGI